MSTTPSKTSHPNTNAVQFFQTKIQFEAPMQLVEHIIKGKEKGYLILDVRDAQTYEKAHIPGAINIPKAQVAERASELPKDKTIVTYCYHHYCTASAIVALELAKMGYQVMEMPGGFESWAQRHDDLIAPGVIGCAC